MIKAIVYLRKKKGITRQQFIDHYENVHSKLIRRLLPTITEYRRNYPIFDHPLNFDGQFDDAANFDGERPAKKEPDFDVITEISFHDEQGLAELIATLRDSPAGPEIAADEENFLDRTGNRLIVVDEYRSE